MCDYCNGEFVGENPIKPILENGIEILVERDFLYAYCNCGVHVVAKIKYCPMCGEKL